MSQHQTLSLDESALVSAQKRLERMLEVIAPFSQDTRSQDEPRRQKWVNSKEEEREVFQAQI